MLESDGFAVQKKELETDARLIAGLGYESPFEIGITLHPLYGFPYLPGTAVKGIARAYATYVDLPAEQTTPEEIYWIFGSAPQQTSEAKEPNQKGGENQRGSVSFFDALPSEFPVLEVDVMTPHYGDYYGNPRQHPPGDWQRPVPVPFLTVGNDSSFLFSLAARDSQHIRKEEARNRAWDWLKKGLELLGAGGKTSAGYGYFLYVQEDALLPEPEPTIEEGTLVRFDYENGEGVVETDDGEYLRFDFGNAEQSVLSKGKGTLVTFIRIGEKKATDIKLSM